jgi:hypothetical protein
MKEQDLLSMVGKNLFNEEHLLITYRELLGLQGIKPFECVGTPEETKAALWLTKEKGEFADTLVMKMFEIAEFFQSHDNLRNDFVASRKFFQKLFSHFRNRHASARNNPKRRLQNIIVGKCHKKMPTRIRQKR